MIEVIREQCIDKSPEILKVTVKPDVGRKGSFLVNEYEKKFPDEMRVLRIGGVHPELNIFLDPNTARFNDKPFENIGWHGMVVAEVGRQLAYLLTLSETEQDEITKLALLHNAAKRFEVLRRRNEGGEGIFTDRVVAGLFLASEIDSHQRLTTEGLFPNDQLSFLKTAVLGTRTGHSSLANFVKIDEEDKVSLGGPHGDSLVNQIVFLADSMVYTDKIIGRSYVLPTVERMHLSRQDRPSFLYKIGFGFDKQGIPDLTSDVEARIFFAPPLRRYDAYANWQLSIANAISRWVVETSGLTQWSNPYPYNASPEEHLAQYIHSEMTKFSWLIN